MAEKKKGFLAGIMEKLDKKLEDDSKKKGCCCCSGPCEPAKDKDEEK